MLQTIAPEPIAVALRTSVGLLVRRLRQIKTDGDLTLPEVAALVRLDRGGPATSSALAKLEQISAQSMGATLSALQERGLVARAPDPDDGRQILLSLTEAGAGVLRSRRSAAVEHLARAMAVEFTPEELRQLAALAPLLDRLAQRI